MEEGLGLGFAILNQYNIVVNKVAYIDPNEVPPDMTIEQWIMPQYDNTHTYMKYAIDNSITNNQPENGYRYDESLNAFIPPRQNDTYILNTETFQWEPDPNLEYDLYADGTKYKWQNGWVRISN